jgi:hypothetical protein
MIPVIRKLLNLGAKVVAGGSPMHRELFRQELPGLETIDFPYLRFRLSGLQSQLFSIIWQLPGFFSQIFREHRALKRILRNRHIDIVISDNCYGLWNQSVYTIFVTHQLHIKIPHPFVFLEGIINRLNVYCIGKFDECWVPDVEGNDGFTGELGHLNIISGIQYIGLLSRFSSPGTIPGKKNKKAGKKILFILSGPEKQRSTFEELIRKELPDLPPGYDFIVIRGLPLTNERDNKQWLPYATSRQMQQLITKADVIVCRSGYSTIMDLLVLGKTAVLVPTPGQTEQEYLADYLHKEGYFYSCWQDRFKLQSILPLFEEFKLKARRVKLEEGKLRIKLEGLLKYNLP